MLIASLRRYLVGLNFSVDAEFARKISCSTHNGEKTWSWYFKLNYEPKLLLAKYNCVDRIEKWIKKLIKKLRD